MGKLTFLDALKRAMPGLPPATEAKTLAFYEQRFVDGAALGRSEDDVARELGDPSRIAMTLRASVFEEKLTVPARRPAGAVRMLLSALGLAIVNLIMVAPAAVVGGLLICLYAAALSFYVGGIAITASGLAGANELVLRAPLRAFGVMDASRTRVIISERGVEVLDDRPEEDGADAGTAPRATPRVVRGAEAVAGRGLRITTHLDDASRSTQTVFGFGMVLGGIALFLLGVVAGRYTLRGLKRYLQMNLSLLRGT
jgi:uncharacterized membrane protein